MQELDSLTGLYNWRTAREKIVALINEKIVKSGLLFYIDLDDFKELNDTCGYPAGDEVLKTIGNLLWNKVQGQDVAARIGGDEFLLFLGDIPDRKTAYDQAMQLYGECMSAGVYSRLSMSMGIACYPRDGRLYEDLAARADEALYVSKHSGKHCFLFYEDI